MDAKSDDKSQRDASELIEINSMKPRLSNKSYQIQSAKIRFSQRFKENRSFLLDKKLVEVPRTGMTYQNLPKLIIVITLISLSSFYYGFSLSVISTVPSQTLAQIYSQEVNNFILKSFITGGIPLGAIFGSLLAQPLVPRLSRRNYLLIIGIFALIINVIIQINNVWLLLACRIIQGVFVGLYLAVVPIYIHQLCPHCVSGSFGAFTQLSHILGVVISYLIGMIFYVSGNTTQFVVRFQFQFTSIILIVQMICLFVKYIPESPSCLIKQQKIQQARQVLLMFHGDEYLEQLLKEKQLQNNDVNSNQTIQINEDLAVQKIRLTWKSILLGFSFPLVQQLSGVNFLVTQAGEITGQFDQNIAPYTGLIVNAIQFVATVFSVYLLDKVGRKCLLQSGNLIIGIINVVIGILCFYINIWKIAFPLIFALMCLFMIVYGLTLGPVVWLYVPQILPLKYVPLAVITNWIGCSFCVIACPIITIQTNNNPWIIFLVLGGFQLLFFIPNAMFTVETKNLTSYEINAKLK